jgi:predicted RNA-binding Zn-ribbon protein involved in translation (DUF1610 family)
MEYLDIDSKQILNDKKDSESGKSETKKKSKKEKRKRKKRAVSGSKEVLVVCLCGTELDASSRPPGEVFACSICGRTVTVPGGSSDRLELAPIEDKDRCAECGVEIEDDQRICHSCGNEIIQRLL